MGIIVAGFPCIGKTTLGKKTGLNVIDLESTKYKYILDSSIDDLEKNKLNVNCPRNPEWPENYLKAIQEAEKEYDIVFVLGKYDFNLLMQERGIKFCVAFPDPIEVQKEEYLERAKRRNNPIEFIETFSNNFEKWLLRMSSLEVPQIKLKRGEYISDALERLGIYHIKNRKSSAVESYDEI